MTAKFERIVARFPPKILHDRLQENGFERLQNGGASFGEFQPFGEGAARIRLRGPLDSLIVRNLMNGFSPDGKVRLANDAGDPTRTSGWVTELMASMGPNVLSTLAPERISRRVLQAHWDAHETAASNLDRSFCGSKELERYRDPHLVMLTSCANISECLNPQISTMIVVLNLTRDRRGEEIEISGEKLIGQGRLLQHAYQESVARSLVSEFGLPITREGGELKISGIPDALLREFAPKDLPEQREATHRPPDHEIVNSWRSRADALGWGPEQAKEFIDYHLDYRDQCRKEAKDRGSEARRNIDRSSQQDQEEQSQSQSKDDGMSQAH